MSVLSATGIEVIRGNQIILSNTSFSVENGELVGLIGPNGAGKTTLLRSLVGLIPVSRGTVQYDSEALGPANRFQFAKKIAYLEQSSRSYWPLAVEHLVMLGRMPHLGQWQRPSKYDWEIVDQAMKSCDIEQFYSRPVTTLSGGEQARVMLARTFATQPEILLADEPVAGLDPAHQLDVMEKLRDMVARQAGVVVVMHDLTLAARYCDRLFLLYNGEIAAEGPASTVLNEEMLRRCYGIEAHFGRANDDLFVIPTKRTSKK